MNRKLLNGLLLLAVATGGVGTFTSCKDTEQDFRNEVMVGQQDLADQIQALRDITDSDFKQNLEDEIWAAINQAAADGEWNRVKELLTRVSKLEADFETLQALVDRIEQEYKEADNQINKRIDDLQDLLEATAAELREELNQLKEYCDARFDEYDAKLAEVEAKADNAMAQALINAAAIENLQTNMERIQVALHYVQDDVAQLVSQNKYIIQQLNEIRAEIADLNVRIDDVFVQMEGLQTQINALNSQMSTVFSFLANKYANLVSGIIIQQSYNPIFGTINTPVGITSSVVGGYFYLADHQIQFPNIGSTMYDRSPSQAYSESILTNALVGSVAELNPKYTTFSQGAYYFSDFDGSCDNPLGDLYVTVNPANVNFQNLTVDMVNSLGEVVIPNLVLIKDNETELKFNMTKSVDNNGNGLYRIAVPANGAETVAKLGLKLEGKAQLVNAFKTLLQNRDFSDFTHIAKTLYEFINQNALPALGLRVSWDDLVMDEYGNVVSQPNAVYSEYKLAAAAIHPLSYNTLKLNEGDPAFVNKKLPTFSPISEYFETMFSKIKNDLNFDLGIENYPQISVDFTYGEVTGEELDEGAAIYLTGGTVTVNGKEYQLGDCVLELNYNGKDFENATQSSLIDFADKIAKAINDQNAATAEMLQGLEDQVNDIIAMVNADMKSIETKINDQLNDLMNKFHNGISGKLQYADNLVDLYNQIASRINELLENPNHYLQVAMYVDPQNGTGLRHLSTSPNVPTRLVRGNGPAFGLYATSFNDELLVPSFQKYVAITNQWQIYPNIKPSKTLSQVNSGSLLNQVYPGRTQLIPVNAMALEDNIVYEVMYQSLDCHGYTSTQTYYFYIDGQPAN